MNQVLVTKHAQTAGRVSVVNGHAQPATISPIAAPSTFALNHGLKIEHISRKEVGDGHAVAILYRNQNGGVAAVSGVISSTRDDHELTRIEDLDFIAEDEATRELHIGIEELFENDAASHRRKLLRIVA